MPTGSTRNATPGIRRLIRVKPTEASEYEDEGKETASRRSRREEEPEEERRPNRVSRRSRDDEDNEPTGKVSKRSKKDEEEDEDLYGGAVTSGWGGAKQLKADMPSDFAQQFTVPEDEPVIIKFLQHEPFANFRQHWAEWLPKGSKLSYVCPNTKTHKVCPICAKGDKPAAKFCFNIVDFTDPENPINSVLIVGFKLSNVLEKMDKDKRSGPLDRDDLYFAVHKTGAEGSRGRRGGTVQTNFNPVKERDLEEDFNVQPLDDSELSDFLEQAYEAKDMVAKTPLSKLEEVADAMDD